MKQFLLLLLLAANVHAAPDAKALLESADRSRGGGLPGLVWMIDLDATDSEGTQKRSLQVSATTADNVAEFTAPQNVKGQRLVMRNRNLWFVRPGLSKPVPISPRQRLLGQVASGDVASTNYAGDYTATWLRQETLNGEVCDVLQLKANRANITYDQIQYWVSQSRQVGVKAEFYTVSGKLFKTAEFEYGNTIKWQNRTVPFVSRMVIKDAVNSSNISELRYRDIKVQALDDAVFRLD